jgi:hypothetical protein
MYGGEGRARHGKERKEWKVSMASQKKGKESMVKKEGKVRRGRHQ